MALAEHRATVEQVLDGPASDPSAAAAGRRWWDGGQSTVDPVGAAAVAAVISDGLDWKHHPELADSWLAYGPWRRAADRLRRRLAVVGEREYADAREVLAGYRSQPHTRLRQRCATSYLMPTETAWVAADCQDLATGHRTGYISDAEDAALLDMLWLSVGSIEQARRVAGSLGPYRSISRGWGATAVEAAGPEVAEILIGTVNATASSTGCAG